MINADKKKEMKNLSEMLLETRNLTKQYGHHKAVDSVDMHIKKGAIYGFIGRNGAGKTTCLKMISGLSKPTCGEIEMFGYKGKDLQKSSATTWKLYQRNLKEFSLLSAD